MKASILAMVLTVLSIEGVLAQNTADQEIINLSKEKW